MTRLLTFVASVLVMCGFISRPAAAATQFLWGQVADVEIDEAAGGVTDGSIVQHNQLVSFYRRGTRISNFRAIVPIRCVSVDGLVSYHDYSISSTEAPELTIRRNRVNATTFLIAEGDLLLNNVSVSVSGRFSNARRGSFTVDIETDSNGTDQSTCVGSMTLSQVRRGARVSE